MPPPLRRREQRGKEPVLVGGAHHRFAMGIGVLHEAILSATQAIHHRLGASKSFPTSS